MHVQAIGINPSDGAPPSQFTGQRPAIQITIATLGGRSFVHLVLEGRAVMLDENHAHALARLLEGGIAEIQARAVQL